MNILYLHQYFSTPAMSSGTRSFEMARRLVRKGHKVYVLSSNHARTHNEQSGFSKEKGIHVWWLPVKYSNNMSYPRRVLAFLAYCYLAVVQGRKLRYDLVFATSTPSGSGGITSPAISFRFSSAPTWGPFPWVMQIL